MSGSSEFETAGDTPSLVAGGEVTPIEGHADVLPAATAEFQRSFVEWLDKSPPQAIVKLRETTADQGDLPVE